MAYSPPSYNAVAFDYTGGTYTPPSYNAVNFDYSDITLQQVYPNATVASAGWGSTAANLYAGIDETSPDDADYDYSPWAPNHEVMKLRTQTPVTVPMVTTNHTLSYRIRSENFIAKLKISLYSGGVYITQWDETSVPIGETTYNRTLSGAEAAAVKSNCPDFSDVQLWFDPYQ